MAATKYCTECQEACEGLCDSATVEYGWRKRSRGQRISGQGNRVLHGWCQLLHVRIG